MSNLNGPSWDEATRDERISEQETRDALPPSPAQTGKPESSTLTITSTRVISAALWRRTEDAFYKQVEVTRQGGIQNLRGGILAALNELLS